MLYKLKTMIWIIEKCQQITEKHQQENGNRISTVVND